MVVEAKGRSKYIRELEAIAKFSQKRYSKWFVKLLGWYDDAAQLFIAMEYIPLGDLQVHMSEHAPMDEVDVREITYQILEGLDCMHREGFAHRDVKPANVLIKMCPPDRWWVKISDLGISKRMEARSAGEHSTFKGTLAYMAPELLYHEPGRAYQINYAATDMWSLGEMAFRMLTNSVTFPSLGALSQYLVKPELFPLQELEKYSARGHVVGFVRSLMKPSPEDRLTSNEALDHKWILPCKASTPSLAPLQTPPPSITAGPQLNVRTAADEWATLSSMATSAASHETATATAESRGSEPYSPVPEETARREGPPLVVQDHPFLVPQERPSLVEDVTRQSPSPRPTSQPTSPSTSETGLPKQALHVIERPAAAEPPVSDVATVVSFPQNDKVQFWDIEWYSRLQKFNAHSSPVEAIAFVYEGRTLASASKEMLQLWHAKADDTSVLTAGPFEKGVTAAAFSPDGIMLASASDGRTAVWLWDVKTGICRQRLAGHRNIICDIVFSPDSTILASVSYDNTIRLWDVKTGACQQIFKCSQGVKKAAFSPDGLMLVSAYHNGEILRLDMKTGAHEKIIKAQHKRLHHVAFSSNSTILAISYLRPKTIVRLWDVKTGTCLLRIKGHGRNIGRIVFSPDGARLASVSYEDINVWDVKTGARHQRIRGHEKRVNAIAFSPDGTTLASASDDGTIGLWNVITEAKYGSVLAAALRRYLP